MNSQKILIDNMLKFNSEIFKNETNFQTLSCSQSDRLCSKLCLGA